MIFSDEELNAAEHDEDPTDRPEWYREAVARARVYLENEDYLGAAQRLKPSERRVSQGA